MDKDKKAKKPSTYMMLNTLDKHVHSDRSKKGSDPKYSNESRRKRSVSPRNRDNYTKSKSSSSHGYNDDSKKQKIEEVVIDDIDHDIPDRSFGDLYCNACDSHMNSEQMWEAHIQGKRHQKHIKKGDPERKYDIKNEDAIFQKEAKESKELLIGLQHCCEIQRPDARPTYQCFLCSANVPNSQQLVEHVTGLKHRMLYLKDHDPTKHELISKTDLKKGMIEPVVEECIQMHFNKYGHGRLQVKVERPKPPASPYQSYKKHFNDDHDNRKKKNDRFVDDKRSDRKKSYPDDKDSRYESSGFRPVSDKDYDYPGPRPRNDSYMDNYYYASDKTYEKTPYYDDRSRYDREDSDYRPRPLTPPISELNYTKHDQQRTQAAYDQQRSQSGPVQQSLSWTQSATREAQAPVDLRAILDQRKAIETSKSHVPAMKSIEASKASIFESLLNVIETLPSMLFLELVLQRVEKMNPTDNELDMLQKIGNHMISIVMDKKLKKLSPDLLNKYQQSVGSNVATEPVETRITDTSNKSSNLNSLMDLISYFKTSQSSDTNAQQQFLYQAQMPSDAKMPLRGSEPAFITQSTGTFFNSSFSTSTESVAIPGLTLSGTSESNPLYDQSSFLQRHQTSQPPPSSNNWPNQYNRY